MAIGVLFHGTGMTQDEYFKVFNQVTDNGTVRAPGLLSHNAGPTEDGFCVTETWESKEALQQFVESRLGAALAAAGVRTQPTVFEIVNSQ